MAVDRTSLSELIDVNEQAILTEWLKLLKQAVGTSGGRIKDGELQTQCRDFLAALRQALSSGVEDVQSEPYERVRELLADMSRSRAFQGFSPGETATFVFSLKQPLFERLRHAHAGNGEMIAEGSWTMSLLLDQLGLYTVEVYQRSREEVVIRQQGEIAELSTPVVKLWDGILALPLIGTLDSARTQVVMENLLQAIVDRSAKIAIIDITGVPTVDTLVAQHLLKTIAAARLMGADCIVSGIRPQIAQTMVHLGVDLNVTSKASLADALKLALHRTGRRVVALKAPAPEAP
jgi:rsbT co-antagonist protein RsbR